ncbi:MAG: hypothetical protein M1148_03525 [Candidatus Thermoplasmatota archaeon]|nr:hypothetical protein [Candidatus Thermoplasmatota archaeon]
MIKLDSGKNDSFDNVLDQVILSIKGLMLLAPGTAGSSNMIRKKISESLDDDLRNFASLVSVKRSHKVGSMVLMAIGEIIIASFLILMGALLAIPPVLTGGSGGLQSFLSATGTALSYSGSSVISSMVDFFLSIILLLSAFYSIREAARSLNEAGIRTRLR